MGVFFLTRTLGDMQGLYGKSGGLLIAVRTKDSCYSVSEKFQDKYAS